MNILLKEQELETYAGEDRIISSRELYEELKKINPTSFTFASGIGALDRMLENTEAGELIVVTGPTGEGKTTLSMTITKNMALKGIQTLWFTLEVTPMQFIKKIMGGREDVSALPLFYLPAKNTDNTVAWIEKRIIEAQVKFDTKVVFIDHIHQIFSLDKLKFNNVSLELGDIVAKLKDLAIKLNLVIFLIAHSKDDPQGSFTREPSKESIRDSGMISRLADSIIAVWRVPNNRDPLEELKSRTRKAIGEDDTWSKIRILKNRRTGKLGTFLMTHEKHHMVEIDTSVIAPAEDNDELIQYFSK